MDLSTIQVIALLWVAEASVDERLGIAIDTLEPERQLVLRALLARGLVRIWSPRQGFLDAGLFSYADAGSDLYVITEAGANLAITYLRRAGGSPASTQHH